MVSIIMPAFNAGKTIIQSIESVIKQTYTDWELIVVDDCSTDDTEIIVKNAINSLSGKSATEDGGKIIYIRNDENRGVAYSRNCGLKESKGDWIAFLDSDDLWTQDKLEKQMSVIANNEIKEGLIFTGSSFILGERGKLDYILRVPKKVSKRDILKQNVISCSSVLVSRELIIRHLFPEYEGMIHEDFAVWLNVLEEIPYAYGIDEPLLQYRISENSKSGNKLKSALMNWNTYRYIGLNYVRSLFYMWCYIMRSVKKWRNIIKYK